MKRRQMLMMMSRSRDDSSSWEEKAFAEDAAAAAGGGGPLGVGGCIWPPRCYSCSFCKRQFRSAQALGGHMNVHRRDRARLRQQKHSLTLQQNLHTSLSSSRVSAQESQSQPHHLMSPHVYKFSGSESEVENKSKREEHSTCLISSHEVETDLCVGLHSNRTSGACKRRKSSSSSTGISGFPFLMIKPYCSYDRHIQYSDFTPAAGSVEDDIDLELRL